MTLNHQLALFLAAAFSLQIGTFGSRTAIPLVALQSGTAPTTIGILLSLFSVIPLLFSIPTGLVADRIGSRLPLMLGCACQVVGLLIEGLWPSTLSLGAASALVGSGHMLCALMLPNIAGAIGGETGRARMFNNLALIYSIGVMAAPLLAGFTLDLAGPRATFLVCALPQAAILIWLVLAPAHVPDTRQPAVHRPGNALRNAIQLWGDAGVRRVMLISILSPLSSELFYLFIPLHGSSIGLSPSVIGSILSASSAATVGIRIFLPSIQARVGPWKLLSMALFGNAVVIATMAYAGNAPTLAITAMLFGALTGFSFPLQMSLLYEAAPEGRKGEAGGVRQSMLYGVTLVAPVMFASLSGLFGFAPLMLVVAGVMTAGARWGWRIGSSSASTAVGARNEG